MSTNPEHVSFTVSGVDYPVIALSGEERLS